MNQKQEVFVNEYMKAGNATQAAIKAGYSEKTAYSIGQRLLKNVEINKEIKQRQKQTTEQAEITTINIIKHVYQIALFSKNETIKLKAYDMLLKHTGGYVNEMQLLHKLNETELDKLFLKLINKIPE